MKKKLGIIIGICLFLSACSGNDLRSDGVQKLLEDSGYTIHMTPPDPDDPLMGEVVVEQSPEKRFHCWLITNMDQEAETIVIKYTDLDNNFNGSTIYYGGYEFDMLDEETKVAYEKELSKIKITKEELLAFIEYYYDKSLSETY